MSTADSQRLDRPIRRATSVLGYLLDPVEVMGQRWMMAKLSSLIVNQSHSHSVQQAGADPDWANTPSGPSSSQPACSQFAAAKSSINHTSAGPHLWLHETTHWVPLWQ
ncbi:unnamed protein product [Pleuronectes platessa]|uniref:Uncharacterized protein n=1 Tax=Pleuronectes platessa TaxID=8262 RepID=A0A9N7V7A1_PLEPL|nr:unnamed protein product [Pleuronectes platessa]